MASFFTGLCRTWAPSSSDHEDAESRRRKVNGTPPSSPLACVFKLMDQNGDGLLSLQEMSQSFHKLGVELSPPLLNSLLSSFPLSHPGFLQFHEFEAFYASICKDLSMHPHHHLHGTVAPCSPSCHHDTLEAFPYETHSCHHAGIHGANACAGDDGHGSSPSFHDDICSSSSSDDDLGSAKSCADADVHQNYIPSPHLATSCVVPAHGSHLDESSHDYDVLGSGGSKDKGDAHMCHADDADLLEAFHVFDKNADGFISMPELQSVMCNLGFLQCQDDSFCRGILQRVDSNGDGLVDFTEFKHMMISSHFV